MPNDNNTVMEDNTEDIFDSPPRNVEMTKDDFLEQNQQLTRENFQLRLRLFLAEQNSGRTGTGTLHRTNTFVQQQKDLISQLKEATDRCLQLQAELDELKSGQRFESNNNEDAPEETISSVKARSERKLKTLVKALVRLGKKCVELEDELADIRNPRQTRQSADSAYAGSTPTTTNNSNNSTLEEDL